MKETAIETSARLVRSHVALGEALGARSGLGLQHLHLVDKPVEPGRNGAANDAGAHATPLSIDNGANNRQNVEDQNNQSPNFVLRITHGRRRNARNVGVIPGADDSLSRDREGEEDEANNANGLQDNLDDGADVDAVSKAEHLLHVLSDPNNHNYTKGRTQQAESEGKQAGGNRAEDSRAEAGDSQAEGNRERDSFETEEKNEYKINALVTSRCLFTRVSRGNLDKGAAFVQILRGTSGQQTQVTSVH